MNSLKNLFYYMHGISKKNTYNLILHRHIGDSYVILCLKDEFEKKYNKEIHFIIKKRQEFFIDLFNIKNYTVFDPDKYLDITDYNDVPSFDAKKYYDNIENDIYEKLFPSIPVLDYPFICSPILYLKEKDHYKNFVHGWSLMLGLDIKKITPPKLNIPETNNILKIIQNLDLNKIILFFPEANSCKNIDLKFWEILSYKLHKKGYYIYTNSTTKLKIKNTVTLDLTILEILYIAKKCKAVFSIRSGISDILCAIQKNCFVFSTEDIYKNYFVFKNCYNIKYDPHEININSSINLYTLFTIMRIINKYFN